MTRRTTVRAAMGALMSSALATGAFAQATNLSDQEKKMVEAAKTEGAVTVLNAQFSDLTAQRLQENFVKYYGLGPNFKFNNIRKGTGQTVAQTRQEIQAGKFTFDVLIVSGPSFFAEALKRDSFLPLDSANWKNHEELSKKSGQYFSYPHIVTPFAYTFVPVWNAACPGMENFKVESYADVVGPALKGKTISSDLTKSLTYTNTVIALEQAGAMDFKKFWADLKATEPLIEFRTEPKMQMVMDCNRPLDMWNLGGRAFQNVVKKPELAKTIKTGSYKEGQVILGNQAAVLKGAPHPNAGKLFIEYLLTKHGTDTYMSGEAINTFLKGYEPPAEVKQWYIDLSKVKPIGLKDWVNTAADVKRVRGDWESVFK